jgi:hypothetical protein
VVYWISVTGLLYSAGNLTANCRASGTSEPLTFGSWANFTAGGTSSSGAVANSTGTYACYTNMTA